MPTPYPMLEETNLSFLCQQAIAADSFVECFSERNVFIPHSLCKWMVADMNTCFKLLKAKLMKMFYFKLCIMRNEYSTSSSNEGTGLFNRNTQYTGKEEIKSAFHWDKKIYTLKMYH